MSEFTADILIVIFVLYFISYLLILKELSYKNALKNENIELDTLLIKLHGLIREIFLLLDKNHTSHKRSPYFVVMLIHLPLTPQSDKGRMRYITIKRDSLSKIVLEDCSISFIVGVDVQDMLACRPNPFRRH